MHTGHIHRWNKRGEGGGVLNAPKNLVMGGLLVPYQRSIHTNYVVSDFLILFFQKWVICQIFGRDQSSERKSLHVLKTINDFRRRRPKFLISMSTFYYKMYLSIKTYSFGAHNCLEHLFDYFFFVTILYFLKFCHFFVNFTIISSEYVSQK